MTLKEELKSKTEKARKANQKNHDKIVEDHIKQCCEEAAIEENDYVVLKYEKLADDTVLSKADIIKFARKHEMNYVPTDEYAIISWWI